MGIMVVRLTGYTQYRNTAASHALAGLPVTAIELTIFRLFFTQHNSYTTVKVTEQKN